MAIVGSQRFSVSNQQSTVGSSAGKFKDVLRSLYRPNILKQVKNIPYPTINLQY